MTDFIIFTLRFATDHALHILMGTWFAAMVVLLAYAVYDFRFGGEDE